MAWVQFSTLVKDDRAEELSDAFMSLGAVSVTFAETGQEEIFEPDLGTTPLWEITKVVGMFDADLDLEAVQLALGQQFPEIHPSSYEIEQIADKDWVRAWMDQYQPLKFGSRLWVVPSWITPPDHTAVNLMLDPGLAFGTGTHPTTAMCLEWLDANPPTNLSVIDYGCGSGILAIAAAKFGAKSVKGTDIDPQAITASFSNSERNFVDIDFALVDKFNSETVDLLLANILSGPLKELATTFKKLVKPQGKLVLSGILQAQVDELVEHYQSLGFATQQVKTKEEWALIELTHLA